MAKVSESAERKPGGSLRVSKRPIPLAGAKVIESSEQAIVLSGAKGSLRVPLHPCVEVACLDDALQVTLRPAFQTENAMAGTVHAHLRNAALGVTQGFSKKLLLVGVGYKAQLQGGVLRLNLGHSHPIDYRLPEGVSCSVPAPTEVVLVSTDKQLLGEVAAKIKSFRPVKNDPYKGKGVRESTEVVVLKEAKKKK